MKVLYLHQHFSTPAGATGTRSYEFARALLDRGHQVTMVCGSYAVAATGLDGEPIDGVRRGSVDGIEVIEFVLPYANRDPLPKRAATFARFATRSTALALRLEFDLVFATSTPLTAGIPGVLMKAFQGDRPFVFEVRDLWPELPRAMGVVKNSLVLAGMSALERASYNAADACVGLAPGIVEGIASTGFPREQIAMIPNGCDLDLFTPSTGPNRKEAVFTGAHGLANGLDAVLDAARELLAMDRKDLAITLIGEGREKPRLMQRAEAEGLTNVEFLDAMPKPDLARRLAEASLGLQILAPIPAFAYGTSPNKFFDYLAAGLPVVVNYQGWMADLVTENICGLASAGDGRALAHAMLELIDDEPRRRAMGERARALAEREFDRRILAGRFVDFLEETLDRWNRTHA